MNRKDIIIILTSVLLVALWIGWVVREGGSQSASHEERSLENELEIQEERAQEKTFSSGDDLQSSVETTQGEGGFPPPTVAVVNGRPERTIHMGVRQYAWDPAVLNVKQGELVRLIVHNADVQHGLVIPDLNVLNIDIPPEGAVIEFEANKVGTFVFFCSYYCGEDHSVMRGKIIVE